MSALDLIQGEADVDDEEGDESFDEETGEVIRKSNGANGVNRAIDDSSEEDEDDEDEDAVRAVGQTALLTKSSWDHLLMLDAYVGERGFHCRR